MLTKEEQLSQSLRLGDRQQQTTTGIESDSTDRVPSLIANNHNHHHDQISQMNASSNRRTSSISISANNNNNTNGNRLPCQINHHQYQYHHNHRNHHNQHQQQAPPSALVMSRSMTTTSNSSNNSSSSSSSGSSKNRLIMSKLDGKRKPGANGRFARRSTSSSHSRYSRKGTRILPTTTATKQTVRPSEYKKLRQVVPSLRRQRDVGKVEVVTEAARYIDHLHNTLIERFILCGIPEGLGGK